MDLNKKGESMKNTTKWILFLSLLGMFTLAGCAYESVMYRTVNDGVDKKEYTVVGRVMNGAQQPIANCKIFLSKEKGGSVEMIPIGATDFAGNYQLMFELSGKTQFWLHFDARDQGYPVRYESISHLLESRLFQYSGNNPIVVNVVIDKKPLG